MQAIKLGQITVGLYNDVASLSKVKSFDISIELATALNMLAEQNIVSLERIRSGYAPGIITTDDLLAAAIRGYNLGLMHGKREERSKRSKA